MFRIFPFILLACGFAFGQGVTKPDLGRMRDWYKNDPLLAETIAVFSLPPERAAERHETLTRLCEEGDFPRWADMVANQLASDGNEEAILVNQESVVIWLEQSDPRDLHRLNLSWVTYGALRFFDSISNRRFPSLLEGDWRKVAADWDVRDKGCLDLAERRYGLARRLAAALCRIHSTAEEGFRLVSAAGGMSCMVEEMDSIARVALATTGDKPLDDYSGDRFFYLRSANGGSGADNTNRHSSVRWLSKRLDEAPADEVIPPSWLAGLKETDPGRAELVAALRVRCSAADLERLWTPERVHTRNFGSVSAMLFRQIFIRAAAAPGCEGFFEKALRGTDAGKHETLSTDNSPLNVLCQGALMAAATSDEPGRESLCRLVAEFMYGGAGVGDELYSPKNMRSHEFTMQAIFKGLALRRQSRFATASGHAPPASDTCGSFGARRAPHVLWQAPALF